MNRRLDGEQLTIPDLLVIAREAGMDMPKLEAAIDGHGENWSRSLLLDATRGRRYEMFWDYKLTLDTRTPLNSPWDFPDPVATTPVSLDREIADWLLKIHS